MVTDIAFYFGWTVLKKNLVEEITQEKFPEVKKYVENENLNLYNVTDLIKILEYYSGLVDG